MSEPIELQASVVYVDEEGAETRRYDGTITYQAADAYIRLSLPGAAVTLPITEAICLEISKAACLRRAEEGDGFTATCKTAEARPTVFVFDYSKRLRAA